jgi:hypothetical protein
MIEINYNNRYFKKEYVLKIVALIVVQSEEYIELKKNNYYSLDFRGNDWFLHIDDVNGIIKLDYRYFNGHKEMLEGLKKYLEFVLK